MSTPTARFRLPIDTFLALLLATVAIASLFPARGAAAGWAAHAVTAAVGLLFLLYGARLSPAAVWAGLSHWRLQGLILAATYGLFPALAFLLSVAAKDFAVLPRDLVIGLAYLCLLPSTVQSSIAFTSIARGNVPAALCGASVSNLLGVVATPALVAAMLPAVGGSFSAGTFGAIAGQILLPFVVGQLLRPWIGAWLLRHRAVTAIVDRGSILLVVYVAFSAGMVAGLWRQVSLGDLVIVCGFDLALLGCVIAATVATCRRLRFPIEDEIAVMFCGSKKSMAGGIPMAAILFPSHAVGLIVLPLMIFHQIQLFVCALLARRYAARHDTARPLRAEPVHGVVAR